MLTAVVYIKYKYVVQCTYMYINGKYKKFDLADNCPKSELVGCDQVP